MKLVYRGNFQPGLPAGVAPWSTEAHVAASLESLDHEVVRIQEDTQGWPETIEACGPADLFLFTSTYGYAHNWDQDEAHAAVRILNDLLPTAAFHLDRFWGLNREDQLKTEPWFRLHHVFTADGGRDEDFRALGINHVWMPPGVYHAEAHDGRARRHLSSPVAFVGSWRSYGHPEWEPYRMELLDRLRHRYRLKFRCWPQRQAIRGQMLNDLYASCQVTVGDSCLAGSPKKYWSDRSAECLGRGGFLIHPHVEGYSELHPYVPTWELGDWDAMFELIDRYLEDPVERERLRQEAAADVRANHTYRNRMQTLIETVMRERVSA